jgi:hypothetical protein
MNSALHSLITDMNDSLLVPGDPLSEEAFLVFLDSTYGLTESDVSASDEEDLDFFIEAYLSSLDEGLLSKAGAKLKSFAGALKRKLSGKKERKPLPREKLPKTELGFHVKKAKFLAKQGEHKLAQKHREAAGRLASNWLDSPEGKEKQRRKVIRKMERMAPSLIRSKSGESAPRPSGRAPRKGASAIKRAISSFLKGKKTGTTPKPDATSGARPSSMPAKTVADTVSKTSLHLPRHKTVTDTLSKTSLSKPGKTVAGTVSKTSLSKTRSADRSSLEGTRKNIEAVRGAVKGKLAQQKQSSEKPASGEDAARRLKSKQASQAALQRLKARQKQAGERHKEWVAKEQARKASAKTRVQPGKPPAPVAAKREQVKASLSAKQTNTNQAGRRKPSPEEQLWARRRGVRILRHEEIDNMEWSVISTRLRAVIEELNGGVPSEQTESEETTVEAFSDEQLEGVAQVLGVDVEDLLVAEEGDLQQALGEMSYKVMAHPKYGRAGLKGKHPWTPTNRAGKALSHAAPAHSGMPGHKSAKVPKHSSAPYARSPKRVK